MNKKNQATSLLESLITMDRKNVSTTKKQIALISVYLKPGISAKQVGSLAGSPRQWGTTLIKELREAGLVYAEKLESESPQRTKLGFHLHPKGQKLVELVLNPRSS